MSIYNNNIRLERNKSKGANKQQKDQFYEKNVSNSDNPLAKSKRQKLNLTKQNSSEMQILPRQTKQSKHQFQNIDHLQNRPNIIEDPHSQKEIPYQKSIKKQNQTPHQRLKSKLAFIFDTANDDESIGSVSYYEGSSQIDQNQSIKTVGSDMRQQVNQDKQRYLNQEQSVPNITAVNKQSKQGRKVYPEKMNNQEQINIKKVKMPAVKYVFYGQIKEQINQKLLKNEEASLKSKIRPLNQPQSQKLQQINSNLKKQQILRIQSETIKKQQIIFERQQANEFLQQQAKVSKEEKKIGMIPKSISAEASKTMNETLILNNINSGSKNLIDKNGNIQSKKQSQNKQQNQFEEIDGILFKAGKRQQNTNNKEYIKSLSSKLQKSNRYNELIDSKSKKNNITRSIQQKNNSLIKEQFNQSKLKRINPNESRIKRYDQNNADLVSRSNQPFSIKLQHVSIARIESKKPSAHESFQSSSKVYQPKTIKKIAQLQKIPSPHENKHLNINYNQDNAYLQEQLANIITKNDQILKISKKIYQNDHSELKQYKTVAYTNDIQKPRFTNLSPVNKVDFKIGSQRRLKTQMNNKHIQTKDLTEQEKKFLALLKKREIGLAKRIRQQFTHNNPNIFFPSSQQSRKSRDDKKLFSKDSLDKAFEEINFPEKPSYITNYHKAEQRSKLSMNQHIPGIFRTEEKPFFPTLNMSSKNKEQQHSEMFYIHSKQRLNNSIKYNHTNAKSMKGQSEHISNNSDQGKSLGFQEINISRRQPSKTPIYNIAKMQKDYSSRQKINLNAKQKYERLKQLLQQI